MYNPWGGKSFTKEHHLDLGPGCASAAHLTRAAHLAQVAAEQQVGAQAAGGAGVGAEPAAVQQRV